ncbi:MAG: hypothetical protein FVQ83_09180 [Chloroflexi bacterium]|nr:hypothetical protein [Chloroflexota bacterium]
MGVGVLDRGVGEDNAGSGVVVKVGVGVGVPVGKMKKAVGSGVSAIIAALAVAVRLPGVI